jgi:hypothetical protein
MLPCCRATQSSRWISFHSPYCCLCALDDLLSSLHFLSAHSAWVLPLSSLPLHSELDEVERPELEGHTRTMLWNVEDLTAPKLVESYLNAETCMCCALWVLCVCVCVCVRVSCGCCVGVLRIM